jgi:hypothetical protein
MRRLSTFAAVCLLGLAVSAQAQIGSGWTQFAPSSFLDFQCGGDHIHHPVGNRTVNGAASYSSSGGVETFRLLNNGCNRIERRADEHYTSGKRQMQGDVKIAQVSNQSIHQLFFGTSGPQIMVKGYTSSGGQLKKQGGSVVIASGISGTWVRYNLINRVGSGMEVYINGVRKATGGSPTGAGYNNKYGLYGTQTTSAPEVQWRNVKHFR